MVGGVWVLSMLIKSFMRISWISLKNWHYRKKCTGFSSSVLQEHNWFKESSKLGLDVNKTIWLNSIYHKLYNKYNYRTDVNTLPAENENFLPKITVIWRSRFNWSCLRNGSNNNILQMLLHISFLKILQVSFFARNVNKKAHF